MIKIVKRVTASAIWDIEGIEVRLQHKKEFPEKIMVRKIQEYREILISKSYISDNTELCKAFKFFGGIAFVAIGLSVRDSFIQCFNHYAKLFVAEWAKGNKCLKSKFVGYEYVFQTMLTNKEIHIKYNFRYILDSATNNFDFSLLVEQAFAEYWTEIMLIKMKNNDSMSDVANRVGDARVSRYFMARPTETEKYLKRLVKKYTDNREIITKRSLTKFIFGNNGDSHFLGIDESFHNLFVGVIENEFEHQKIKFIAENYLEFAKNKWKLYKLDGITLKYIILDFTKVSSPTLKQELKAFFKYRYSYGLRTSDRNPLYLLKIANILCEIDSNITFFADVDVAIAKSLQLKLENDGSQVQMMNCISMCNLLFDFLCSDDNTTKLPKPHSNPFSSLKMVNAHKYNENTPYIPDCIIRKLEEHIDELSPMTSRMFKIFVSTGMRAKEVAYLKEDCLSDGRYEGRYILKYTPYKVLKARRKLGLGDYHQIYVEQEIKDLIDEQIFESEQLRKVSNSPYIFLHQNKGRKICMPNTGNYCEKIKQLIKKHNICDENGTLWNFTTRQCRKTLVVKMIENNATVTDLVYQLGHLNYSTVMKYYAEVKSKKLAELNTDFYQKQFGLLLSNEQLVNFSEEERKQLYVDFRLSKRRVEFGYCIRKSGFEVCSYLSKTMHCVSCPNLCTGVQYLAYWKKLLKSQIQIIAEFKQIYKKENLTDYEDFAEFILENRKLLAYKNVVKAIKEANYECDI
ncbi:MAG: site-specific integrase [Clostridia bacterium]